MDSETIAVGVPFVVLLVGLSILVTGVFLGSLNLVTPFGGAIAFLGVAGLARVAMQTESEGIALERAERTSDEPRPARGAKR